MKDQIVDYIMDGDAVFLNNGVRDFLSIYMRAEIRPVKGAVVVMHGRGFHPNWPEVVYPLRTGLVEYGWSTLSIQMPVLDNDASFYDYLDVLHESHPRIDAAINFLKQQKIENIILLAHSCSVHMAIDWLHKNPDGGSRAFIGVSMGSVDRGQPMTEPFPLETITIPLLDIWGENDYSSVIYHAPERMQRIKRAGNLKSEQRVVQGADHYYREREDVLLFEVLDWLDSLQGAVDD